MEDETERSRFGISSGPGCETLGTSLTWAARPLAAMHSQQRQALTKEDDGVVGVLRPQVPLLLICHAASAAATCSRGGLGAAAACSPKETAAAGAAAAFRRRAQKVDQLCAHGSHCKHAAGWPSDLRAAPTKSRAPTFQSGPCGCSYQRVVRIDTAATAKTSL